MSKERQLIHEQQLTVDGLRARVAAVNDTEARLLVLYPGSLRAVEIPSWLQNKLIVGQSYIWPRTERKRAISRNKCWVLPLL